MHVLLISPLPRIDPACGDLVYTQSLLDAAPDGLTYKTYADAIADGSLVEHGRRARFLQEPFLSLVAKGVNLMRRSGLLFWEPFRYFSVRPGIYDAVHVHVFSCGFRACDAPILVSNAAPLRLLYRDARGWPLWRVQVTESLERVLAVLLGVNHTSYRLPQITRVIAFTERLKQWYVSRGIVASNRVDVVPIYLPPGPEPTNDRLRVSPSRIGFIAKDFDAKGGPILLKAFEQLRSRLPNVTLEIVGCPSRLLEADAVSRGIVWRSYIPREELLATVMPRWDVFAYPTRFDGQPLVLLEAMAAGLAIVTSNYEAMPEMVAHGQAGKVVPCGDAEALAKAIEELLEPTANQRFRGAARARFEQAYSADVVRDQLKATYERAIASHKKERYHEEFVPA